MKIRHVATGEVAEVDYLSGLALIRSGHAEAVRSVEVVEAVEPVEVKPVRKAKGKSGGGAATDPDAA